MKTFSDKEVILKVKNGEINYFEIIVKKYSSKVYRLIRLKIIQKEDIEDLVQNVFIKFYKAIARFNENLPLLPYLYQIARNEIKMFYRSKKPEISLNENLNQKSYLNSDYYQDTIGNIEEGFQSIKDLKEEEKRMLIMRGEGYSYQEISQRFNRPLNTIKTIIRRVKEKLKVKIKKER